MHFLSILKTMILISMPLLAMCQSKPRVSKSGMEVSWRSVGEELHVKMTAPTQGWLAVGWNPKAGLEGTHLVMGAVSNGKTILSDRFILAPGHHQPVDELGGKSAIRLIRGEETSGRTTIEFAMPLSGADRWHHSLQPGKSYTLLLAFSQEDDFLHHSVMRTSAIFSL